LQQEENYIALKTQNHHARLKTEARDGSCTDSLQHKRRKTIEEIPPITPGKQKIKKVNATGGKIFHQWENLWMPDKSAQA